MRRLVYVALKKHARKGDEEQKHGTAPRLQLCRRRGYAKSFETVGAREA